jgi:hypothetical protein
MIRDFSNNVPRATGVAPGEKPWGHNYSIVIKKQTRKQTKTQVFTHTPFEEDIIGRLFFFFFYPWTTEGDLELISFLCQPTFFGWDSDLNAGLLAYSTS